MIYKPVQLQLCYHCFCNSCLDEGAVIVNNLRCPLCRTAFTVSNIKPLPERWEHIQAKYPLAVEARKKMIRERVMVKFLLGNTTEVLDVHEDNKYNW